MNVTRAELIHHKIQAIIRQNNDEGSVFEGDRLRYLGMEDGKWWYMINGYKISTDNIDGIEKKE